jgi:hypothetical protein
MFDFAISVFAISVFAISVFAGDSLMTYLPSV